MPLTLAQQYVAAIESGNVALRCRLETELDNATAAENDQLSRLDAPDALYKAALWYGRHGITVFPCEFRGKKPLTNHGFADASLDTADIQRWWTRWPTANIGAPTGILFDVIDIDGREGVGSVYFRETPLNMPAEIGHSLTSRQAGHHIFIAPTGRGNKAGFMPGVDYRGKGGYVILPPSVGANGRRYQWTKPLQVKA